MKMSKNRILALAVLMVFLVLTFLDGLNDNRYGSLRTRLARVKSTSSPKGAVESKKGRAEYFFMMLRDPATNQIPGSIRQKELEFAKVLKKNSSGLNKTAPLFNWKEAGPNDVGGRTRALAIDVTDPNTILAGGVSGGMWKSTDNGATWKIKSTPLQVLSVTSIAQDKRPGFTDNWYYVCGEYPFTSACAPFAMFSGDGVYKSTDNGESWFVLESTGDKNFTDWNYFDFCLKVIVTTKGNILIATAGFGIFRSTDGGRTFSSALGGPREHEYSDVAETLDGELIAVISSGFLGSTSKDEPGVYRSTDEGLSWAKITPSTFPEAHRRSVIAIAPSNPDIVYILTDVGETVNDRDDVRFHKINLKTGESEDRSANMPDFSKKYQGIIYTQGCYNLTLAVKPDDENLIIIGATSLFRSMNGFASKPNNRRIHWIGGYHQISNGWMFYPGLHPDIHAFAFDPKDPRKLWVGHDGGLSYTSDITNILYPEFFPWENKNNGYNVTQFYMVTISDRINDKRIIGGTQDNGSPFFTFDGNAASKSKDASSGDGGWAYFGKNFIYASSQEGRLIRYRYSAEGNPDDNYWAVIYPPDAKDQLFIDPYAFDPGNEDVIYYPAGNVIWRNRQISSIPDYTYGTMQGWEKMSAVSLPHGYVISSMAISKNNPSGTLYYAAFSYHEIPKIYKLPGAQAAATGAREISIPDAPVGSYIHHVCVNPDNGNEILVVMSNYNIVGLYYSSDGGETYSAVEGNLTGTNKLPGPSLRGASILPAENGPVYFAATSIGVFSTMKMDGANTVWNQEGEDEIGNTIVNFITSRKSDGRIAVGTHGRGIFLGEPAEAGNKESPAMNASLGSGPKAFSLLQNYPNPFNPETVIRFNIPEAGHVIMKVYDVNGKEVSTLLNDYKDAGEYRIRFNGAKLSSGIYYYSIQSGNYAAARKMIFIK